MKTNKNYMSQLTQLEKINLFNVFFTCHMVFLASDQNSRCVKKVGF